MHSSEISGVPRRGLPPVAVSHVLVFLACFAVAASGAAGCAARSAASSELEPDASKVEAMPTDDAVPEDVAPSGTEDGPDEDGPLAEPDIDVGTEPEPSAINPSPSEPSSEPVAPVPEPGVMPEPDTSEPAPEPADSDAGVTPEPEGEVTEPEVTAPNAPDPGEYGELTELPEANSEMAVAEAGGLIYVLGGYPASREVQTTVQRYDPQSDSWETVAPLPTPLHHPVAIGVDGLIYSLGGQVDHSANPDIDRTLVYDPLADDWSDLTPMPTARGAGAGAAIDRLIYVVGGRPPASNAFEVYDIDADSWEVLPNLPTTYADRNHLAAAAIGGKIYVAGGRYDGGGFTSPMTDSLDVFDPATNQWSLAEPMLRPRGGINGVAAHGCFHVFGGEGSGTGEPNDVFPDHDVYDPTTDEWTQLPPLPVPVHGVTGAVFVGGLIYMPGGGTSSGGSSGSTLFQVFNPTTRCD